jgi:succinate dehydrogenase / fumarate reductase cytochrome b subunit
MSTTAVGVQNKRAPGFWGSTNGKKAVMAVTGAILFIFVIGHLAGNLQVFEGPAKLNAYGKLLHEVGELLWPIRIILLISVVLHIWATVQLALLKKRARPVGYSAKKAISSTYPSRTMYWSGPILLAFVIFHLLHLTAGNYHPGAAFIEGDVYHNVVTGFHVRRGSFWNIYSINLQRLHLHHGIWSAFQSVGMNHPRHTPILKTIAWVVALVIVLGYISIPISVMAGVVK